VREAVVLDPGALSRSFMLKELVRRAEVIGPRRPSAPVPGPAAAALSGDGGPEALEPFEAWLDRAVAGRRPADLLGTSPGDDIADPLGMSRRAYERTAAEIEDLVDRFVDLAFPASAERPSG